MNTCGLGRQFTQVQLPARAASQALPRSRVGWPYGRNDWPLVFFRVELAVNRCREAARAVSQSWTSLLPAQAQSLPVSYSDAWPFGTRRLDAEHDVELLLSCKMPGPGENGRGGMCQPRNTMTFGRRMAGLGRAWGPVASGRRGSGSRLPTEAPHARPRPTARHCGTEAGTSRPRPQLVAGLR